MEPHRTRIPPLLPDQAPSAPPKRRRGKHPVAAAAGITAPPAPSSLRPQAPRPASGGGVAVVPTRSEATMLKQARPTARGRAMMSTPSQQKACGSKKVSGDDSTHLSHAHMQSPMQQSTPACTTTEAEAVNMDNAHQLFEETPPCMTDGVGDFTDMMSDGVFIEDFSISMPYEVEEHADEDDLEVPTPVAKRTHSRSANYTTQEDTALVMAWESISLDAVKGTDQTSSTYWMRIHDHYHRNKTCGSDRSIVSLQHRWGSIQECCNKWAGCMVD